MSKSNITVVEDNGKHCIGHNTGIGLGVAQRHKRGQANSFITDLLP